MAKISGFTFIKNGLTLGYPILESVLSIESICFEVVINVGFNNPECTEDDGTWELDAEDSVTFEGGDTLVGGVDADVFHVHATSNIEVKTPNPVRG